MYDIVYADFPWSYYGQQDKWAAAAKFYKTMTDDEIMVFPVEQWLNTPGILFLWATSPRLDFALDYARARGLHYRGVAFVWIKTRLDGKPIGAQGIRASITKPTSEYVLAFSNVPKGRPLKLSDESVPQVLLHPRGEHSQKPPVIYEYLERMYPQYSKVELFARNTRPGWDSWGDEVGKFDTP